MLQKADKIAALCSFIIMEKAGIFHYQFSNFVLTESGFCKDKICTVRKPYGEKKYIDINI